MVPKGRVRDTQASCNFNAGKSGCFDEVGVCGYLLRWSQGKKLAPGVRIERQVSAVVGYAPDGRQQDLQRCCLGYISSNSKADQAQDPGAVQNASVDEYPLVIADEGHSPFLDVGHSSVKDGDGSGQGAVERARSPLDKGRELAVRAFHMGACHICRFLAWV